MLILAVEFISAFKYTGHELVNTTNVNMPLSQLSSTLLASFCAPTGFFGLPIEKNK